MPEIVEWSDFSNHEGKQGQRGEINRLRLESGKSYKVRFVGPPLQFYKYFVAGRSAICASKDSCPVRQKYNIEPSTRYAVNILDRNDIDPKTGLPVLKIMECPPMVLKPVVSWWKGAGQDPGGKAGPDFFIEVTGKQKSTRYQVSALQVTPLTEDEKEYVKANIYDLAKIYKAVPENEIENRLFGKDENGQGGGGGGNYGGSQQQQRQMPSASAPQGGRAAADLPF